MILVPRIACLCKGNVFGPFADRNDSRLDFLILTIKNQTNSFLSLTGCTYDQTLVVPQDLQPILNVCHIVSEAFWCLNTAVADKSRSSKFCYKLFLAVCFRAEEGDFAQAI